MTIDDILFPILLYHCSSVSLSRTTSLAHVTVVSVVDFFYFCQGN